MTTIAFITFLIAQLLFVFPYLYTTKLCINTKLKISDIIYYIVISPFASYIYMTIFLGILANMPGAPTVITESSDFIIIFASLIFMQLYTVRSKHKNQWASAYYQTIYLVFYLLEVGFTTIFFSIELNIICNIIIPIIVIAYYFRNIIPLIKTVRNRPAIDPPNFLIVLPLIAELLFVLRSIIYICYYNTYTENAILDQCDVVGVFLALYAYGVIFFVFVAIKIIFTNISAAQDIREKSLKNEQLSNDIVQTLIKTVDAKDPYTNGHSIRVAQYTRMLCEKLYPGDTARIDMYYNIALLHDIGKIGISDTIINKPSSLTDEEYAIIKNHTVKGAEILREVKTYPEFVQGAHYHHERYDGKGYPEGLKGDQIPDVAAVIAVADAYDAMTSKRSYRDALPQSVVRQEIAKGLGTQFRPEYGQLMLALIDEDVNYDMRQKDE